MLLKEIANACCSQIVQPVNSTRQQNGAASAPVRKIRRQPVTASQNGFLCLLQVLLFTNHNRRCPALIAPIKKDTLNTNLKESFVLSIFRFPETKEAFFFMQQNY